MYKLNNIEQIIRFYFQNIFIEAIFNQFCNHLIVNVIV
jgi:hypothetical protein